MTLKMDEIFDRIKSLKIPRKYLITGLILTEILGILVLVWFLRVPLSQKYLVTPPKAYSILQMDNSQRYVIAQGDYLTGNTTPNTKIVTLLRRGGDRGSQIKLRQISDNNGNWFYQIPYDLAEDKFQFAIGTFDNRNNLNSVKVVKLKVVANNLLSKNSLYQRVNGIFNKINVSEKDKHDLTKNKQKFYYVDLEYNPKTNKAVFSSSGTFESGSALFKPRPDATTSGKLNYKVEIISPTNKPLFSGWSTVDSLKESFIMRANSFYIPNATMNVYIDDKLIWSGKIKENES